MPPPPDPLRWPALVLVLAVVALQLVAFAVNRAVPIGGTAGSLV